MLASGGMLGLRRWIPAFQSLAPLMAWRHSGARRPGRVQWDPRTRAADHLDLRGNGLTTDIVARAINRLDAMSAGESLSLQVDAAEAIDNDLRAWCEATGNHLLDVSDRGDYRIYRHRKGRPDQSRPQPGARHLEPRPRSPRGPAQPRPGGRPRRSRGLDLLRRPGSRRPHHGLSATGRTVPALPPSRPPRGP